MDNIKRLTEEDIANLSAGAPYEQSIDKMSRYSYKDSSFKNNDRLALILKYETGGVSGGSCWDSSNPTYYSNDEPKPKFKLLNEALKILKPDLTFLQFHDVEELMHTFDYTVHEYYGNRTDYEITYVYIDELENTLANL